MQESRNLGTLRMRVTWQTNSVKTLPAVKDLGNLTTRIMDHFDNTNSCYDLLAITRRRKISEEVYLMGNASANALQPCQARPIDALLFTVAPLVATCVPIWNFRGSFMTRKKYWRTMVKVNTTILMVGAASRLKCLQVENKGGHQYFTVKIRALLWNCIRWR